MGQLGQQSSTARPNHAPAKTESARKRLHNPRLELFVLARLLLCLCKCSKTFRSTQKPFSVVRIVRMDGLGSQMICPREELRGRVSVHSIQSADSALRHFCHNIRRKVLLTPPVSGGVYHPHQSAAPNDLIAPCRKDSRPRDLAQPSTPGRAAPDADRADFPGYVESPTPVLDRSRQTSRGASRGFRAQHACPAARSDYPDKPKTDCPRNPTSHHLLLQAPSVDRLDPAQGLRDQTPHWPHR